MIETVSASPEERTQPRFTSRETLDAPPRSRPSAQLVFFGPSGSRVVALHGQPVTLGSHVANEVRLEGGYVSPHHCSIIPAAGGGHRLLGLETYQDLVLNGRPIKEARLEPFDRFEFGGHVVVYLPGDMDAQYVRSLISTPDAATCRLNATGGGSRVRDRLLWLLLMIQSLPPGAPIEPALNMIVEEILRWSGYTSAALLVRRGDEVLEQLGSSRSPAGVFDAAQLRVCQGLVDRVLTDREIEAASTALPGFEHMLCLPVCNVWSAAPERRRAPVGQVEGALLLGSCLPIDQPQGDSLGLLGALTRQLAILLGNVRVFHQATVDPLTGLASRGCSRRVLDEEFDRARRLRGPLACLILDVDDFKSLNDTYGHLVGDEVLEHLAGRLRAEVRGDDFACRWGGEEFLVLLPGTDLGGARRVAEKIVRNVTWHQFCRGGPRVTVSVGVAVYPDHAAEADELLEHADQALYSAKHAGKGRYEVFCAAGHGQRARAPEPVLLEDRLLLRHPLLEPVELGPGRWTLGRNASADVCLYHPQVSRDHGVLLVEPTGGVRYEDHSSNGTLHNDQRVRGTIALRAGDRLTVGPFELEVVQAAGAVASPPTATALSDELVDLVSLPAALIGRAPARGSRSSR